MMIKRCLSYLGVALALCFGSFQAQAVERVTYLTAQSFAHVGSYAAEGVKHELTLSQWRAESQSGKAAVAANLIALSNHFGLASAAPFGVPDWDASAQA